MATERRTVTAGASLAWKRWMGDLFREGKTCRASSPSGLRAPSTGSGQGRSFTVRQAVLYVGIGVIAAISAAAAPMDWVYEAIDPVKTSGDHGAALDAQGHAHVVYGRDALYYDWEDAQGWHSETADTTVAPADIAMALDESGRPHVVFLDQLTGHLIYTRRDAIGWSIETIADDVFQSHGRSAVLDLDAAGWPHVGYTAGSHEDLVLKHLNQDASGWHAVTVGSWSEVYLYGLTIRTADDGEPHLACATDHHDAFRIQVFHAWHEPSGWQSAQVDLSTEYRGFPLQLDDAGRLHLVYLRRPAILTYVLGTQENFVSESLVEGWYSNSELAVNATGVPHVLAGSSSTGLQHWTKVGGAWHNTVLDPGSPLESALTFDVAGQPHLLCKLRYGSFPDYTNLIKSVWQDVDGWHSQEESTPPWQEVITTTLLLTLDNQPRILQSTGSMGMGTVYSWRNDAGWHERVLAEPSLYATSIRLALNPDGNPHIAYNGGSATGFRYAWHDATGWNTTPLEQAKEWGDEGASDLAFDSQGRLHMGYLWAGTDPFWSNGLMYTVRSDGDWDSTTVNTNRIYELALAIDETDYPHFLAREYIEATGSRSLVHIWQDDGGWHQETAATLSFDPIQGGWGVFPDIRVDETGELHICYFDHNASNTLRYGNRTAQGWQLTTVDAGGTHVGIRCSLTLDEENQPHIAYGAFDYTHGNHFVRYARKDDAGWHISPVDSLRTEYPDLLAVSLDLAPGGTAHVVYSLDEVGFRYARSSGSRWDLFDLENGMAKCAIAIDPQGRPHIAYCNPDGRSNLAYLWPSNILHRISWAEIPSSQEVGNSFPVTLTARNPAGDAFTSFTNTAALSGFAPGLVATHIVAGTGTDSWEYPFYTRYHDARTQAIYPAGDLGQACTITSLALEVTTPPGQALGNWTIRLKHTSRSEYSASPEWETNGWVVVFQGDEPAGAAGWRTFDFSTPFEYNGSDNLLVDFSFNNASYSAEGLCRSTVMGAYRSINAFSDSRDGDPLGWSGGSPVPVRSQTVPNLVLGATIVGPVPVSVSIGTAGPFVDGVWTGIVTVLEAATNLVLRADDGAGHGGETSPFDVHAVTRLPVILTDDGQFGIVGGHFSFNLLGQDGRIVVVEGSTDLRVWIPLETHTVGSGTVYFSDPSSATHPHRFYRLLQP